MVELRLVCCRVHLPQFLIRPSRFLVSLGRSELSATTRLRYVVLLLWSFSYVVFVLVIHFTSSMLLLQRLVDMI